MCSKAVYANRRNACASPGSLLILQRERMSGLSATTASLTTFSPFKTKSLCPSSARSNRSCVWLRSSVSNANGRIVSTAYDLVLHAQPDVYSRIPERVTKALLLLERALTLDPSYALAHAHAAQCHHTLFLRGGMHEENRTASIRHAEAAMAHGPDDASALAFAGF